MKGLLDIQECIMSRYFRNYLSYRWLEWVVARKPNKEQITECYHRDECFIYYMNLCVLCQKSFIILVTTKVFFLCLFPKGRLSKVRSLFF